MAGISDTCNDEAAPGLKRKGDPPMRIQSLSIQDFRGFRRFEMKDLGRINLIVGANNSGKTTVLEAINLLAANGDTPAIWSMLLQRGEASGAERSATDSGSSKPVQIWRLFRGYDIEIGAAFHIEGIADGRIMATMATIEEYDPTDSQALGVKFPPGDPSEEVLPPRLVRMRWSHSQSDETELLIPMRGRDGTSSMAIHRNSRLGAHGFPLRFLTASSLTVDTVISLIDDIVLTPEEDLVTDALRIIEPNIDRIASSGTERLRSGLQPSSRGGVLVRLEGVKNRVPIGSLGDGIWRMLGLALSIVHCGDGILLVDDIDTGLHHTVMEEMWKFLDSAARKYNVQIFATTHSRDCYESLAAIAHGSVSDNSDVTIQRIERGREKAVAYSEQTLVAAAKHGYEVR
jgi:ABC-type branched-subunit amino acid transport system ATPase component